MSLRVDAHQHYWQLAQGHGDWPPVELTAIYRDFLPADLAPELAAAQLDGSLVVQANPSAAETDQLLELAAREPSILGVVGWVDLSDPSAAERIVTLARQPKFRGVRVMAQGLPAAGWVETTLGDTALAALADHDLSLDLLVLPRHLPGALPLAQRHPALRLVIDHAAKPAIASRDCASWAALLAPLADQPNVHCKLSGLLTEARPGAGLAELRPYLDEVFALFGPQRVLWGSDWPVLELVARYQDWYRLCADYLASHPREEVRRAAPAVFGGNAQACYRLG